MVTKTSLLLGFIHAPSAAFKSSITPSSVYILGIQNKNQCFSPKSLGLHNFSTHDVSHVIKSSRLSTRLVIESEFNGHSIICKGGTPISGSFY